MYMVAELWRGNLAAGLPGCRLSKSLVCSTYLCIPSATAHLPAMSGQPVEEWLSAIAGLNVFLLHARIQSPGRDWLFSGVVMTATSGSTEFHYMAQWGQLGSRKSMIRDQESNWTYCALRQGHPPASSKDTLKSCFRTFLKAITTIFLVAILYPNDS